MFNPTRKKLWLAFSFWAAIAVATTLMLYGLTFAGRTNVGIGGDFVAFQGAARAAIDGAAAKIYDARYFAGFLKEHYPGRPDYGLSWQYPPSYLLFVLPFTALPYMLAFTLWSTGTAAGYFAVIRMQIKDRLILFAAITGPAAYAAYVTGQNGFLTAALLALAASYPKTRPILAGIAAGLLTAKPHLGLLIPVAWLAAGCWRAMAAAAVTALGLAAVSVLFFGPEPWTAFAGAVFETAGRLRAEGLPLAKMATPFSAALFAGAPRGFAAGFHLICAAIAAVFVWRVWRRVPDGDLRAAALIACVLLAAPYGFHYELIILALPVALIAARATRQDWLKYEPWFVAMAYLLPGAFGLASYLTYGISHGFVTALIVFALVMRRIAGAAPDVFAPLKPPAPG